MLVGVRGADGGCCGGEALPVLPLITLAPTGLGELVPGVLEARRGRAYGEARALCVVILRALSARP